MTYSSERSAHFLSIVKTAISTENFCGEDVRFSNEYEALELEVNKAQSLIEGVKVDWQKVLDISETILRAQSRDLRVGAWLTWALYQKDSFAGLLAGVGMIRHLCEHHWQAVHPLKPRTRAAAINWLVPRMDEVLVESVPIKEQLPLFRRLVEDLEGLDAVLTQQLGSGAPLLLPLSRRLKLMIERAANNQPAPGPVGSMVAQIKEAATQLFTPGSPVDNEREAQKALRGQQENARTLCTWWMRQKATDIRALRLNRTLIWLSIDSLPERNAEQITMLRTPPSDKLKNYQDRFEQGAYADLLVDLEASVAGAPFWLDGQRMVWECLQRLNAELAMREVEVQLSLFLQRLPAIVELRFHDGAPFASDETKRWISAHVLVHLQAPSEPVTVQNDNQQGAWEEAYEEAMPILRRDGLKPAVQLLKQGLQSAQGGRVRFFWQLSLARLCHQAKKYDLAKAQLETLDQQLQSSGFAAWEPDLALQVLYLLHNCCELLPQNAVVRERKDDVFQRLCHLDLEVALP
jgi:type VI secretion system protein VasJ